MVVSLKAFMTSGVGCGWYMSFTDAVTDRVTLGLGVQPVFAI